MAKTLKEAPLTTASARAKLDAGDHFRSLDADAHIGYRKGVRAGVWFARFRNRHTGKYVQQTIGAANDQNDKPADGLLTYQQAERVGREWVANGRQRATAAAEGPAPTVRSAVEAYIAMRDDRDSRRAGRNKRSDAGRLALHVIGRLQRSRKRPEIKAHPIADRLLYQLTEKELAAWRADLPGKVTHQDRTVNDFRAALNDAYSAHKTKLPATFRETVRDGLKAPESSHDEDDGISLARDNQILTDLQVSSVIAAAKAVDEDYFRLVVVLAATGCRFSQAARMRVRDVQREDRRLLVPSSRKGKKNVAPPPARVKVEQAVLDALLPAVTGRSPDDWLLTRQTYKRVSGFGKWQEADRARWTYPSQMNAGWETVRQISGIADIIPYALRHSSIVRAIKAGLPIQFIAARHDTSVQMIEQHYARFITAALEKMEESVLVPVMPQEGSNVVQMRGA